MKRAFSPETPELMDMAQAGDAALEKDLDDLERLNVRLGGHEIIQKFLPRWLVPDGDGICRVLDLATASGDIPRLVAKWARARGVPVEIDAVDFNPATLAIARKRSVAYPEINYIEADMLDFDPGATRYDIVLCSQALHHFSEEDAVRVLALCRTVSRGRVLVADLTRRRLAQFAVWLITATLFRAPMMKYDSRLSIRRAFSTEELCALARRAGWKDFQYQRFFPVRQIIWLDQVSSESAIASATPDQITKGNT